MSFYLLSYYWLKYVSLNLNSFLKGVTQEHGLFEKFSTKLIYRKINILFFLRSGGGVGDDTDLHEMKLNLSL